MVQALATLLLPLLHRACVVRWLVLFALLLHGTTYTTHAIYVEYEWGETPFCTVFNHMPKSAGSSIAHQLYRGAALDRHPRPALCAYPWDPNESCFDDRNGYDTSPVIVGSAELIRARLEETGRDCEYFTMMREPISRLVSAFFYCPTDHDIQTRPTKWCGYAEEPEPATERLLEFAEHFWKNQAFRQMTFGLYCPPNAFCEESPPGPYNSLDDPGSLELLQQVRHIISSYKAVGIVEHWDISMQLFNARITSSVMDWTENTQVGNPGEASGFREEVLLWARANPEIHRILQADLLLYNYAVGVFKQQTTASLGISWPE